MLFLSPTRYPKKEDLVEPLFEFVQTALDRYIENNRRSLVPVLGEDILNALSSQKKVQGMSPPIVVSYRYQNGNLSFLVIYNNNYYSLTMHGMAVTGISRYTASVKPELYNPSILQKDLGMLVGMLG